MKQNNKISFDIKGKLDSSFNSAIGGTVSRLDWLAKKEQELKNQQSLVGKFNADKAAMKSLSTTQRNQIASLKDLESAYKSNGGATEKNKLKIQSLKEKISETNKKLNDQKIAVGESKTALKKAGIDVKNLDSEEKRLKATLEKTEKAMQRRTKVLKTTSSGAKFLAKSLFAVGTAALGASAMAFKFSNSFAEHGDNVAKTADKLGISTNALQELRYSAERSGMSVADLDKSLEFMQKNTVDAAQGTGEAVKAFNALGLEATELKELKPEESLRLIADKLKNVENKQERVRYATQIFGRSGTGMINMLKKGSAGLDELATSAYKAGYVLNEDGLRAAEDNRDAYLDMTTSIKGVSFALGNALMPTFTETFRNVTNWLSNNQDTVRQWGETAKTVFSVAGNVVLVTGKVAHTFFSTLWSAGEKLGGWAYETVNFFTEFKDGTVDALNNVKGIFTNTFDWIESKFSWLTDSLDWLSSKASSLWSWFSGDEEDKNINVNKTSKIAAMNQIADRKLEQRANQVNNNNKNNNIQLHNKIIIQGNADPKKMEQAIYAATQPLFNKNYLMG